MKKDLRLAMITNASDYLKTRRGLKALLVFCKGMPVVDAIKKIRTFGLSMMGTNYSVTLESNPDVWDTLFDMYCMQHDI